MLLSDGCLELSRISLSRRSISSRYFCKNSLVLPRRVESGLQVRNSLNWLDLSQVGSDLHNQLL